jgi:hypothetical protein
MGFLPNINIDIAETVREFLTVLRSIDDKLDLLIELQTAAALPPDTCTECEQVGRLRCPRHGPVKVPTLDVVR